VVQFLLKLLLKQISCCAPRFPLILRAKFHSLYVKESEILPPTPQPWLNPNYLAGTGLLNAPGKPTEIATIEIIEKTHGLRFL